MPVLLTLLAILVVMALAAAVYSAILARRYRMRPPADEIYAAHTPDGWTLRLFRHKPAKGEGEPVLVVPGVSANHYEFEFPIGDSLADVLSENGYDVWILDPRGRRSATPPFDKKRARVSTDDQLTQDLPTAVDYVRAATRYENVHYIGHSMGGMLLYAYDVAYGQDNIASAVTLGSPPGFEYVTYNTPRALFTVARVAPRFLEWLGRVLAPVWVKLRPKSRLLPLNWRNLHPKVGGKALYHMLEVPPLGVARDLDRWAREKVWRMLGDEIDVAEGLSELEVPVFAIFGGLDPLAPPPAAREFYERLDHPDKLMLLLSEEEGASADYNHIDLVMGRNSRTEVFEPIVKWLRRHPITERLQPVRTASELEAAAAAPGTLKEEMESYVAESRGDLVEEPAPDLTKFNLPAQTVDPSELTLPVLPGATMEELARLAKEIREEDADQDGAVPRRLPAKRVTGKPTPAAKKKAAAKKPPVTKKPVAKKKPAAKRRPRPSEE